MVIIVCTALHFALVYSSVLPLAYRSCLLCLGILPFHSYLVFCIFQLVALPLVLCSFTFLCSVLFKIIYIYIYKEEVSNLVFYAQSTITVILGRKEEEKEKGAYILL